MAATKQRRWKCSQCCEMKALLFFICESVGLPQDPEVAMQAACCTVFLAAAVLAAAVAVISLPGMVQQVEEGKAGVVFWGGAAQSVLSPGFHWISACRAACCTPRQLPHACLVRSSARTRGATVPTDHAD